MIDLDELIRAAEAAAKKAARKWRDKGIDSGRLEGLLETGRVQLARRPSENVYHHAGYLSGHLTRWMHERGKALDATTMLTASAYAAAVADDGGQQSFSKPDSPVPVHLYAAIRTEKKTATRLSEADERMMFGWLLEQSGTAAAPALIAKMERLRARRHERTGKEIGQSFCTGA